MFKQTNIFDEQQKNKNSVQNFNKTAKPAICWTNIVAKFQGPQIYVDKYMTAKQFGSVF